jgi:hypothetical protein
MRAEKEDLNQILIGLLNSDNRSGRVSALLKLKCTEPIIQYYISILLGNKNGIVELLGDSGYYDCPKEQILRITYSGVHFIKSGGYM